MNSLFVTFAILLAIAAVQSHTGYGYGTRHGSLYGRYGLGMRGYGGMYSRYGLGLGMRRGYGLGGSYMNYGLGSGYMGYGLGMGNGLGGMYDDYSYGDYGYPYYGVSGGLYGRYGMGGRYGLAGGYSRYGLAGLHGGYGYPKYGYRHSYGIGKSIGLGKKGYY